jgi:SnoaL-like domain
MDTADRSACADLIQLWGICRDQGRWQDLLATFHPDGQIAVSWFRGLFSDFVERCKANFASGPRAKHLLWPALVQGRGMRAVAETNVTILVRQQIEGVWVDMTSRARFLDRIERSHGRWRIAERAAIYEQDRLDPVEPSIVFVKLMQAAKAAHHPEAYRYMAYRVTAAGRALANPVHYDGLPETEALKARYEAWLEGR